MGDPRTHAALAPAIAGVALDCGNSGPLPHRRAVARKRRLRDSLRNLHVRLCRCRGRA